MASWDDLVRWVRVRYEVMAQDVDSLTFRLPTTGERTQLVYVHHKGVIEGHDWLQIESPIARLDDIDLRALLVATERAVVGGAAAVGETAVFPARRPARGPLVRRVRRSVPPRHGHRRPARARAHGDRPLLTGGPRGRRRVPPGAVAVRLDVRRGGADPGDRPGHGAEAVVRRRLRRADPCDLGHRQRHARPALPQPPDRSLLGARRRARDALALHLVDLTPARDWGASTLVPFFGGLTGTDRTALLNDPLTERTWIYEVDRARGTVTFSARRSELVIDLPLAPMLGTVGVAPAAREVRSSLTPDAFGGNMDTPEMRAGATCFLPVNEPGAIFSVGDGHYRQGEGESCGTAVEGAMDVTLIVELVKGAAPAWPRIENDDEILVVGSSRPLEDAWRISQVEMVAWLGDLLGLDRLDAYQLLTQTSLSPLANVVDTNYSAVTKVRKALLPPVVAFGGMHAQLRELAASL